jgi:hypothetical protein
MSVTNVKTKVESVILFFVQLTSFNQNSLFVKSVAEREELGSIQL